MKLATAYLTQYPSDSYTLRDLGSRLEQFLREEPHWSAPREELALDMIRFEWAQVVAFDGAAESPSDAGRHPGYTSVEVAARLATLSFPAGIEFRRRRFFDCREKG